MFKSAKLKVERANQHIFDLNRVLGLLIKNNPNPLVISNDPKAGAAIDIHLDQQAFLGLGLILGDAVHNLRTALDHAMWELTEIDGGKPDRYTKFPFGGDKGNIRIDYEASIWGIENLPRDNTKKFLIKLEAYKGGAGDILYSLHKLDIADKHSIITPLAGKGTFRNITLADEKGAKVEVSEVGFDMHGIQMGMSQSVGIGFSPGLTIQNEKNTKASVDIFFGNIDVFKGQPIIPTLVHLRDIVSDTIRQFETFVRQKNKI